MKRFLVFAFDFYYPVGGWKDFRSAHDSLEQAKSAAAELDAKPQPTALTDRWDEIQIVDVESLAIIWTRAR